MESYILGHLKVTPGDMGTYLSCIEKYVNTEHKSYCVPLNLTKYVMAKKDLKLRSVINSADIILPDGKSIVLLSRRFGYKSVNRISGIDLAESIIRLSSKYGWKLFFLGTSICNLRLAIESIKRKFDYPEIVGHRQGFFSSDEIDDIIKDINASKPDILFLGLGLPQKEYFIFEHFKKIQVKFCLPVGGAFDVWAGKKRRCPLILQKIGLEWVYRSLFDRTRIMLIMKYGLEFIKDFLIINK